MSSISRQTGIATDRCLALVFPSFNMPLTSVILSHIDNHLKQYGIHSRIVPNHLVQNNVTNFRDLEKDEHLMQRMISVISEILSEVVPEQRRHILLIGLSGGNRFMAAFALANKLGLVPEARHCNIAGMMAFNMYTSLRISKSTTSPVTELAQINHMDIRANLTQLTDTIIYDVYADLDTIAADTAASRRQHFTQAGLTFKQHCIKCCDIKNNDFYEQQNGEFFLYTEVSGHNLQNAFLQQEDGTFKCAHRLHGTNDTPMETLIDQFLIETGVYRLQ